jgi:hypothetical protein
MRDHQDENKRLIESWAGFWRLGAWDSLSKAMDEERKRRWEERDTTMSEAEEEQYRIDVERKLQGLLSSATVGRSARTS